MENNVKSTRHAKYNLNYHFVWIPKYRRNVLKDEKAERVRELIEEIADEKDLEILEMEIMPDHIHLFVSSPPRHAPSELINWFKGISSRRYNKQYDDRIKWTRSYFVGSAGNVSAETIERYIQEQEEKL